MQVSWEYQTPHSQERVPGHKRQHMWSQSLYLLCGLLEEGLLNIGEIDPLNRRLSVATQPDPPVQGTLIVVGVVSLRLRPPVVLLSEDKKMSAGLRRRGITAETVYRAEQDPSFPVKILPARYLSRLYQELGQWCSVGLIVLAVLAVLYNIAVENSK